MADLLGMFGDTWWERADTLVNILIVDAIMGLLAALPYYIASTI